MTIKVFRNIIQLYTIDNKYLIEISEGNRKGKYKNREIEKLKTNKNARIEFNYNYSRLCEE